MLDEVRIHAASVADSARFVHIQPDGIRSYAEQLPLEVLSAPQLDPQTHYIVESEPELTLAYIVTLDAINFGSGYFPHLAKRPDMSGYFTVAASLKDAWPLSPNDLCRLTPSDCARIFGQSLSNAPIGELMGLFAQALNDLGEYVTARYHGSFTELVESAHQSAESLVHILTAMPFYRDKGFYKRAQLTAADLATARVQHFH